MVLMTEISINELWISIHQQDGCSPVKKNMVIKSCNFMLIFFLVPFSLYHLPRLVLWTVLHMPVDSLVHFAPDCSSWGVPSRGSSLRNYINVNGNVFSQWVRGANQQISRTLSLSIALILYRSIFDINLKIIYMKFSKIK